MVSANMEVPVRGTANFLPFQGGAQRLLREDGRDRWVALIPPPFSKRWAGVFGHRPFALPAFGHAPVRDVDVCSRILRLFVQHSRYGLVDGLAHFHAVVRAVSFEFGFEVRVHLERGHDLADGFAVAASGVVLHVHELGHGFSFEFAAWLHAHGESSRGLLHRSSSFSSFHTSSYPLRLLLNVWPKSALKSSLSGISVSKMPAPYSSTAVLNARRALVPLRAMTMSTA
uniref:Uncharacterized protein n=1 Tax=Bifidobacterium longum TaxID=216816 RepID=Q83YJ9_BIFLN|nr:unknown [Bifidobacterium longum]